MNKYRVYCTVAWENGGKTNISKAIEAPNASKAIALAAENLWLLEGTAHIGCSVEPVDFFMQWEEAAVLVYGEGVIT